MPRPSWMRRETKERAKAKVDLLLLDGPDELASRRLSPTQRSSTGEAVAAARSPAPRASAFGRPGLHVPGTPGSRQLLEDGDRRIHEAPQQSCRTPRGSNGPRASG